MPTISSRQTHLPAPVTVYETLEYDRFAMVKGNRSLDVNKIRRIISEIEEGTNLLPYCPVLVNESGDLLNIIDGQHRFTVSKKLKQPVYYILADQLSLYQIARMNSNTEKWKGMDFVNCYCEIGNSHYLRLKGVLASYHGLTITDAINLLHYGKVNTGSRDATLEKFRKGEFTVLHETTAINILDTVASFTLPFNTSRIFMMAIEKVINAGSYPLDELAQKVNAAGLERQSHWRKYLTAMEEIVSKGKQKRVAIY